MTVTTTSLRPISQRYREYSGIAGGQWTNAGGAFPVSNSRTVPDPVKRDYRALIKARQNATTPMSGRRYIVLKKGFTSVVSKGSLKYEPWTKYERGVDGFFNASNLVVGFKPTDLLNVGRGKFLKKCRQAQRPFSAGIFIAEIRRTIQLVRSPLQALYRRSADFSQRAKKLADRRLIFRTVDDAAELRGTRAGRRKIANASALWLEYSFGAKPLLADVDNAMAAVSRKYLYAPVERVHSITRRNQVSGSVTNNAVANTNYRQTRRQEDTATAVHAGAVKLTSYGEDVVSSSLGVHPGHLLQELLPTAYEAFPWSFLFDYFVNAGEVLEAATFMKCDLAWARETIIYESFVRKDIIWLQIPSSVSTTWSRPFQVNEPFEGVVREFTREPYAGAWIPTLDFKIPISPSKWLNMAALAGVVQDISSVRSLKQYRLGS